MQEHPSLATRRNAAFAEVERRLAGEIARRTGRDLESDLYPTLVVTAASGALKAAVSVWQERGRRDPLADLIDEAFQTIAVRVRPAGGAHHRLTAAWSGPRDRHSRRASSR